MKIQKIKSFQFYKGLILLLIITISSGCEIFFPGNNPGFKPSDIECRYLTCRITDNTNGIPLSNGSSINNISVSNGSHNDNLPEDWEGFLKWDGRDFKAIYTDTALLSNTYIHIVDIQGTLSKDLNSLESFVGTETLKAIYDSGQEEKTTQHISLSNLPFESAREDNITSSFNSGVDQLVSNLIFKVNIKNLDGSQEKYEATDITLGGREVQLYFSLSANK